jgi:membrane protease YdiL (CAAX protease family)
MLAVLGLAVLIAPAVRALHLVWAIELPLVEIVCFAVPAALVARITTGSVRGALALRWPPARVMVGALLFGATFWFLNAVFVAPLLADHTSASDRELAGALAENVPLVLELVVLAIIPAICEEMLVRGAIARGLSRRFGPVVAVLLSSAYFAFLHLSIARTLPTLVLGGFLAAIVLRTGSLVPAILIHALNNGAALLLAHPAFAGVMGAISGQPLVALAVAAAGTALGLFWMLRRR